MTEVIKMWGKARKSVEMQIYKGKIQARQTPQGAWLISADSVVQLWGEPSGKSGSLGLIKDKNHDR